MPEPVDLRLRQQPVNSVFQLLGDREDDMSFSVGWALARSPHFLASMLLDLIGLSHVPEQVTVLLQERDPEQGITDLEIVAAGELHIIVEAKRGWVLPDVGQMSKYAKRLSYGEVANRLLAILSECSPDYTADRLPPQVDGVPTRGLSWHNVASIARTAALSAPRPERLVLQELITYLEEIVPVRNVESNKVYVVSLSRSFFGNSGLTFIDVVTKRGYYICPVGPYAGWPKIPPNYIAFRYGGRLRSIHFIEEYHVTRDPRRWIPEIVPSDLSPVDHFIYKLGPGFAPLSNVPTGSVWPSGRVWCLLDTLFTSDSIAEARDETKRRLGVLADSPT